MPVGVALGSRIGSYRIKSVIGGGGASLVYRAEHARLGTPVAIKVLAPEWGAQEDFRERFFREINEVVAIGHPNVIPIYDADVHEESVYWVMRYVAGGDLRGVLARTGALDPRALTSVLAPVAAALDASHARGLVHGHVKPSNVLIDSSADGALEHVYLSDFALPRDVTAAGTLTAFDPAALDYAGPEQLCGEEPTSASDVYALAAVAYHVLTSRAPFAHVFGGAHLERGAQEALRPPSAVRTDLPQAVDVPILRAMADDPRERHGSCVEFVGLLASAVADREATQASVPAQVPAPAPSAEHDSAAPLPAAAPPAEPEGSARVPAAAPPAEPEAAAPVLAAAPPAEHDGAGEAQPPRRRRKGSKTPAIVAATLVAVGVGYAASTLKGGDDDGSSAARPTVAAGGEAATLGTSDPMKGIVSSHLDDFRCSVSKVPPGGQVLERADCVPRKAGRPPVRGVTLTLFNSREDLDSLFRNSRVLTPGFAADARADCSPRGVWEGSGRWFEDPARTDPGGRMLCHTAKDGGPAGRPTIVWTVTDSALLAQATADDRAELGRWWVRARDLAIR